MSDSKPREFIARWSYDSASPMGAQYLTDGTADALAEDAKSAIGDLLQDQGSLWPDTGEPIGPALCGGAGPSPSVTWHAQAVGSLLELGFLPSAECVQTHLRIIERRLCASVYRDPAIRGSRDAKSWALRTRHVAWVLACLSELPIDAIPADVRRAAEAQLAQHERVTTTAYRLLAGLEDTAPWIGIAPGELFWSEHWNQRELNFLNTVYASIAICRAARHGFQIERDAGSEWTDGGRRPEQIVRELIDLVRVETTESGPRSRLDAPPGAAWPEPWTRAVVLPPGVVGLLALLLVEYSHVLINNPAAGADLQRRSRHAWTLAQRLGHELASRTAEWTSHVDAFCRAGAEGGWWYVPSYSLGVRAVLETAVATPTDRGVREAFTTITATERIRTGHDERRVTTWADPTRAVRPLAGRLSRTWNELIDIGSYTGSPTQPTAASIHAAVMAFAALRRAYYLADPRTTLRGGVHDERPRSPFRTIVATRAGERFKLEFRTAADDYVESIEAGRGRFALLRGLAALKRPGTYEEIARSVDRTTPEPWRVPREAEGVRPAVRRLNQSLGVDVVSAFSGAGLGAVIELTADFVDATSE
jgi:hypothetical protein